MAEFQRHGNATWRGDLRSGKGVLSSNSGVLSNVPYSFVTRFENEPGTNPEELIAAAHAACYSMAFSNYLAQEGHTPEEITTHAICFLTRQEGGWAITKMRLEVTGRVPGLDQQAFAEHAHAADNRCPVSNLLRPGLEIEVDAKLAG